MTQPARKKTALSDILEGGAKLGFHHIVVFLRITAPLILPVSAVLIAVAAWRASSSGSNLLADAILVSVAVINVLAAMLAGGACMVAAAEASRGTKPNARAAIGFVLGRASRVIYLVTLLVIAIAPAIAMLVLPGLKVLGGYASLLLIPALFSLWLTANWAVALPAMLEEKIGIVDSLRRSVQLVHGSFGRALGTVVLGGTLALFAGALVAILFSIFSIGSENVASAVLRIGFALGELFVAPFFAAFLVVLYRDLLDRQQGSSPDRTSHRGEHSTSS